MKKTIEYKGYHAVVTVHAEDKMLHAKIEELNDDIHGKTMNSINEQFKEHVNLARKKK